MGTKSGEEKTARPGENGRGRCRMLKPFLRTTASLKI